MSSADTMGDEGDGMALGEAVETMSEELIENGARQTSCRSLGTWSGGLPHGRWCAACWLGWRANVAVARARSWRAMIAAPCPGRVGPPMAARGRSPKIPFEACVLRALRVCFRPRNIRHCACGCVPENAREDPLPAGAPGVLAR